MKNNIKNIVFYLFFFWILYFFWKTIYSNFWEIQNYNFEINFWYLFLSLMSFLVFFLSLGILWKGLLFNNKSYSLHSQTSALTPLPFGEMEITHLTNKEIHYINAISWISKYIPWKVAMIATKVIYLEKKWFSKKQSFLSCLYEHIFQIIASFLISFPFIIYYFWWSEDTIYIILSSLSLIIWLFFIQANIFNKILNFVLKLLKKSGYKKQEFLDWKNILRYIVWYALSMIIKWISFVFLVASIISINSFNEIIFYIFAWVFAWVIGILAIFTPNWLWIREWVLTLILSLALPLEIAILLSVISRLWFSICDGVIGLWILASPHLSSPKRREI